MVYGELRGSKPAESCFDVLECAFLAWKRTEVQFSLPPPTLPMERLGSVTRPAEPGAAHPLARRPVGEVVAGVDHRRERRSLRRSPWPIARRDSRSRH